MNIKRKVALGLGFFYKKPATKGSAYVRLQLYTSRLQRDVIATPSLRLAKETFIPQTRVSEIIKGKRRITADTALRFSRYFGTSAKFWLGLQTDYDLEEGEKQCGEELNEIKPLRGNAA